MKLNLYSENSFGVHVFSIQLMSVQYNDNFVIKLDRQLGHELIASCMGIVHWAQRGATVQKSVSILWHWFWLNFQPIGHFLRSILGARKIFFWCNSTGIPATNWMTIIKPIEIIINEMTCIVFDFSTPNKRPTNWTVYSIITAGNWTNGYLFIRQLQKWCFDQNF